MSEQSLKGAIKHPFEVRAAQAVEDIKSMEEGFFTPDIYFTNGPKGLWAAHQLRGYIIRMGYQAEVDIDTVGVDGISCLHLKVGKIPEQFLQDIKDFMSTEEVLKKKTHYCVRMVDNGQFKKNAETAMWHAFKAFERRDGGSKKSRHGPG